MSKTIAILVPDIGNYKDVDVIDIAVQEGDTVQINDTLITLETEKATMDVPTNKAGIIASLKVKIGDKVSEGSIIAEITPIQDDDQNNNPLTQETTTLSNTQNVSQVDKITEIYVPDIGNFKNVDIIDIAVQKGDIVQINDTLITLETEKATMDVPANITGIVMEIKVKTGDKVSQGDLILKLKTNDDTNTKPKQAKSIKDTNQIKQSEKNIDEYHVSTSTTLDTNPSFLTKNTEYQNKAHAGPAVRKLARELGVDLSQVKGTAPHHRIVKEDVQNYVKRKLQSHSDLLPSNELNLLPWPDIDFSQFGPIETQSLNKIKKISGKNLSRNWVMIPHVTQHDEADITELEDFRNSLNQEWATEKLKVSPLAFIIQACVKALKIFPEFNASLNGDQLILKKYYHIGFAADTPKGLVVPVIKNADQKGLKQITQELTELSQKARAAKLNPLEMQGSSFTISSLGGIGGTYFTPIINAPEVAILGVCRSQIKPVWNGNTFQPRLMCPLSLSYDHRVIDGALACRFTNYLTKILADYRRLSL